MSTNRPTPDPFDDVRSAFADLQTSEKAAFVFEATFATLGQALHETGRRVAEVIDDLDIDAWFRAGAPEDVGAPPAPPPAPPPPAEPPASAPPPPPGTPPREDA